MVFLSVLQGKVFLCLDKMEISVLDDDNLLLLLINGNGLHGVLSEQHEIKEQEEMQYLTF